MTRSEKVTTIILAIGAVTFFCHDWLWSSGFLAAEAVGFPLNRMYYTRKP